MKMSKRSKAKLRQGYSLHPIMPICNNCIHFLFDRRVIFPPSETSPAGWVEDTNIKCAIGGFAVQKDAGCKIFAPKEYEDEDV
jgi:hypothetical protein